MKTNNEMSHSLVSPADRALSSSPTRVNVTPKLGQDEIDEAMKVLNKNITFTQVERYYADPPQINQKIALVSFVPSQDAKPDKDNIYGMMKIRGVYATEEEANERAEFLIRNVDSYHDIFHAFVGRPFPITTSCDFAASLKTIDIRKKTTELISEDILSRKRKEKEEMEDIQEREKKLLEESKRAQDGLPMDPFDEYITANVKRAQLAWTFHETKKKILQMKESFQETTARIQELDTIHPDFVDSYKEKYMEARRASGIPDDNDSFIRYLGMDLLVSIEDAEEWFSSLQKKKE
jgi:hypothetical protein